MSGGSITLRQADERTLSSVETLLAENDLPTADVRSNPGWFYLAFHGDDRVGVGGIEPYGTDGLLRSVVVERSARGNGLGTALTEALEEVAREEGIATLYLLTTTASAFFASHGYEEIDRIDAPDAILRTTEFAELCPASATCMRKSL
ncbi:arsenic resistance N-acetyltransferase ArsN2 [Halosolutus amylolyticus]|uniref:Arsenic resistance N-acetyltransferase ArsN2 n=1 Tax=Halosolutus amylolyticus TaxID=2932267 RepID=A0ABD5PSY2_9EURY|nr:arsenic resistance N-acetyltransferase ArsN2 [Halosolutus amylolyticus]